MLQTPAAELAGPPLILVPMFHSDRPHLPTYPTKARRLVLFGVSTQPRCCLYRSVLDVLNTQLARFHDLSSAKYIRSPGSHSSQDFKDLTLDCSKTTCPSQPAIFFVPNAEAGVCTCVTGPISSRTISIATSCLALIASPTLVSNMPPLTSVQKAAVRQFVDITGANDKTAQKVRALPCSCFCLSFRCHGLSLAFPLSCEQRRFTHRIRSSFLLGPRTHC